MGPFPNSRTQTSLEKMQSSLRWMSEIAGISSTLDNRERSWLAPLGQSMPKVCSRGASRKQPSRGQVGHRWQYETWVCRGGQGCWGPCTGLQKEWRQERQELPVVQVRNGATGGGRRALGQFPHQAQCSKVIARSGHDCKIAEATHILGTWLGRDLHSVLTDPTCSSWKQHENPFLLWLHPSAPPSTENA